MLSIRTERCNNRNNSNNYTCGVEVNAFVADTSVLKIFPMMQYNLPANSAHSCAGYRDGRGTGRRGIAVTVVGRS